MTNWLERAKRETSPDTGQDTANTDERDVTTVTAVRYPARVEYSANSNDSNGSVHADFSRNITAANDKSVPMTREEETIIRAWLMHIDENDPATIADVLNKCRTNLNERKTVIRWGLTIPAVASFADDRHRCDQCANLTNSGLCLAARRSEIDAPRLYQPLPDIPLRCKGYIPDASASCLRTAKIYSGSNEYANGEIA